MTEKKNELDDFPQSWDVVDFESDTFQDLKKKQRRPEFLVRFIMKKFSFKDPRYAYIIIALFVACTVWVAYLIWPKDNITIIQREPTPQELRIQELIQQSRAAKKK
jgi:hypothetical protein